MPRLVDETKMVRIKNAAIELVVNNGYGGASISAIAKKAEVAEGYLYRYYNGKLDLITDLLYSHINVLIEKLENLIKNYTDVDEIITLLFQKIFEIATNNSDHIKFMHVLMHDYNFQISEEQRKQIKKISSQVISMGKENNKFNPSITEEEIFLMTIIYPIEFINMRMKDFFGKKTWSKSDISRTIEFCINTLK